MADPMIPLASSFSSFLIEGFDSMFWTFFRALMRFSEDCSLLVSSLCWQECAVVGMFVEAAV